MLLWQISLRGLLMRIGLSMPLPAYTIDPAFMGRTAERLGFESIWYAEHPAVPVNSASPFPATGGAVPLTYSHFTDPYIALARASAVTTTLKLATGITLVPQRNPLLLAKEIAALDHHSGGRFILGVGTGWLKEEVEIFGGNFARRWTQTREALDVMKALWTQEAAEFHGEFFNFPRSGMFPVPKKPIPMWLGGHSLPAARRAAFYDGYMPMRLVVDPEGTLDPQTVDEFALIEQIRSEHGLTGQYDRKMVLGCELADAGKARRLEESSGVGHLQLMVWQDGVERTLQQKHDMISRFAEKFIHGA